jgi:membrane-bound lytic murein transglycosylase A
VAFATFVHSASYLQKNDLKTRELGFSGPDLRAAAARARLLPSPISRDQARLFFEENFSPVLIEKNDGGNGFLTGYYEPVHKASATQTAEFTVPIYSRPDDLVEIDDRNRPANWPDELRFARKNADDTLEPFDDRQAIESGALAGQGLELAWLRDKVDVFFIHIQGSARLEFIDGRVKRIAYNGKSGHAYTAIGSQLIKEGALDSSNVTMTSIRNWLAQNPVEISRILWTNKSFIFFAETGQTDAQLGPVAAGHVPLTPGRSLAIDRNMMTFHLPIWIEANLPVNDPAKPSVFNRLMVGQDTGSAILGPNRADVFVGSGETAGAVAGSIQHGCRFVVLAPNQQEV